MHLTAAVAAVAALTISVTASPADVGHAAGIPVASTFLSTYQPSALPPACTTQTLTAAADSWVNEQQTSNNYGTVSPVNVTARNGRDARTLVNFTLPSAPAGCTLVGATLRAFNGGTTTGRSLSVFRAGAAWTETAVTWANMPATAGTAVTVTSTTGWMQWSVTGHVQTMYSGARDGFIIREATEGGGTTFTHAFDSREATNKPQLVLEWST